MHSTLRSSIREDSHREQLEGVQGRYGVLIARRRHQLRRSRGAAQPISLARPHAHIPTRTHARTRPRQPVRVASPARPPSPPSPMPLPSIIRRSGMITRKFDAANPAASSSLSITTTTAITPNKKRYPALRHLTALAATNSHRLVRNYAAGFTHVWPP